MTKIDSKIPEGPVAEKYPTMRLTTFGLNLTF